MAGKKTYTETDERLVWDLFSQGLIFKQVSAELGIPTGTIYRLLERATKKWGTPNP
jgi:DNA-binding CsgD family transcriptional regulator